VKLEYFINLDERGEFYSDVRNAKTGETLIEFHTEEAIEWTEDGDNIRDAKTVLTYLIDVGVVRKGSTIEMGN
jgi:hypothetical protein